MRPLLYWPLALLLGIAATIGTYELAGWHVAAAGTGLLYAVTFLLLGWTDARIKSLGGEPVRSRLGLWGGAYGGLVAFAGGIVVATRSLPSGEELALYLVVFAAGAAGMAVGLGMALVYVDGAGGVATDSDDATPA